MNPHDLALSYTAIESDLPWNRRPMHRQKCARSNKDVGLVRVIGRNGVVQFKAICQDCGGKGQTLPYADIAGLDIKSIPVVREHQIHPCERCGSTDGTELHHWAPRHLFDDADDWPTSMLCRACHAMWHATVTPKMSSRRGIN